MLNEEIKGLATKSIQKQLSLVQEIPPVPIP